MRTIAIMLLMALLFSAVGFRKYVWFISIGYGFSIAAIGAALLIRFAGRLTLFTGIACVLLIVYGVRLGGYLTLRELKSGSYNAKMKTEIKDGKGMSAIAKIGIWVTAALLYACETAPITFRLDNGSPSDGFLVAGIIIMALGLVIESVADIQKARAKKVNAARFVDTGLYRIVRCPNYFGEMTFWTGVFVTGLSANRGVLQWTLSILGYVGIIYVMFGGARRLELRQNRTYGDDPDYQAYVKNTPIMLPFIPLYSVAKYKWLVA